MNDPYEEILNLPHYVSERHRPMNREARAAQFMPFSALTGYEAAVKEAARNTEKRTELDEAEKERLDRTLQELEQQGTEEVEVVYFLPDARKSGGEYIRARGRIKRFDRLNQMIFLDGGAGIPMEDILRIEKT